MTAKVNAFFAAHDDILAALQALIIVFGSLGGMLGSATIIVLAVSAVVR